MTCHEEDTFIPHGGSPGTRHPREPAVKTFAGQAANASSIVDEAHKRGPYGSHPVTLQAKMLRLELLDVKGHI